MNYILPNQKTSMKEKLDPKWYIPTADYLINQAINSNDKVATSRNLDAANGIVDNNTYKYVLNPLQIDSNDKLPGELRNVDFLTPIKEKNLGEYIELPYSYVVTVNNSDIIQLRDLELKKSLMKLATQSYINMINKTMETGMETKEVPDLQEYADEFIKTYIDKRAIDGQARLQYLNDSTDFENRRIQAFYYWWACEEVYTHRYLENGELKVINIPPLEAFPIENGNNFVEDMDGFVWRFRVTFNQFWESYRHLIRKEDEPIIEELFRRYKSNEAMSVPIQLFSTRMTEDLRSYYNNIISENGDYYNFTNADYTLYVNKIEWKTFKKIKHLVYINALGELEETEVPEDYKLDKENGDVKIEEEWIQTVMTMYKFGNNGVGVYTEPMENPVQRRDPFNLSRVKLSFGGRKGLLHGITINPIPARILPHLALYRIYTLQLERTIAKYKGDILTIPQSMLNPDTTGSPKQKYFYMLADNTIIYDDSIIDLQTVVQGFRVVGNPGLQKYLQVLSQIIRSIKLEAWDLANMNDERYGETSTNQSVTSANENRYIARIGSSLMITMFNKMLEREHLADLEYSKIAWINGKVGSYWSPENNKFEYIVIDGEEHSETEYGIYVRNSAVERQKLEEYKRLAFSASQNGDFELAGKAIEGKSSAEIAKYIEEHTTAMKEFEQSLKAKEQEIAQQQIESEAADKERQREHDMNMLIYKSEIDLQKTSMEINSKTYLDNLKTMSNVNNGGNNNEDLNKIIEREQKERFHNDEIQIKEKALELKKAEIESKERIARINKNKYDVSNKKSKEK